jgi:hypothetical protein
MRRGWVELLVFLDLGQPLPRAVEQLVTLGRGRACLKPSRHLAQLYRSFFDWKHRLCNPWVSDPGRFVWSPLEGGTAALHETCGVRGGPRGRQLRGSAWE